MTTTKRVSLLLRLPPHLNHAIAAEVEKEESNLNDVVVSAVAAHYEVPFEPSQRRGRPSGTSSKVLLRMPDELKLRIQWDALDNRTDMTATLLKVLGRRFGVIVGPTPSTRTSPFGGGNGGGRSGSQVAA